MKTRLIGFLLIFLSGFLLMLSINFYSDWKYEEEIVSNLTEEINDKCQSKDLVCLVDTALYYTHVMQDPMRKLFSNRTFTSPKQFFTRHSFSNFYFGKGACGAYASFFCRVMAKLGYRTKFVILDTKQSKGAHIIICIEQGDKLILVDPYYGHPFKDSTGRLSEIQTVSKNWHSYYSKHLPADYLPEYDYQYGWHYTNWQKLGPLSGVMYKTLRIFMPKEKVDNLSLRYYIIKMNKVYVIVSFIGFLVCFVLGVRYMFLKDKPVAVPQSQPLK